MTRYNHGSQSKQKDTVAESSKHLATLAWLLLSKHGTLSVGGCITVHSCDASVSTELGDIPRYNPL